MFQVAVLRVSGSFANDWGRKSESYGSSPSWNSRQEKTLEESRSLMDAVQAETAGKRRPFLLWSITNRNLMFQVAVLRVSVSFANDRGRKSESYRSSPSWNSRQEKTLEESQSLTDAVQAETAGKRRPFLLWSIIITKRNLMLQVAVLRVSGSISNKEESWSLTEAVQAPQ